MTRLATPTRPGNYLNLALYAFALLVQVIYYVAEVSVMILIIGFGQKAGEGWFRRAWVPWGGVLLALTWGLVHILTQGLATGRSLLVAYPILLVLFIV